MMLQLREYFIKHKLFHVLLSCVVQQCSDDSYKMSFFSSPIFPVLVYTLLLAKIIG